LGTLQYADRAKQIKNKAIVNEDPTEKLIRGLKEELEQLKKQLAQQATSNDSPGGPTPKMNQDGKKVSSLSKDELNEMRLKFEKEKEKEMNELREQMLENERLMKEQAKTWEERLKETELAAEEQVKQLSKAGISIQSGTKGTKDFEEQKFKKRTVPHLFNLNEDPLMSGVVVYFLDQRITRIGRKDALNHNQHICLSGLSIVSEHATISYDQNEKDTEVTIMPIGGTNAKVRVNGKKIIGAVQIHHNDRVIIGNNHVFRFVHPMECRQNIDSSSKEGKEGYSKEENSINKNDEQYDYAYAMREINEAAMEALTAGERAAREQAEREAKEMEAKVRSLENEMEKERKRANIEASAQEENFRLAHLHLERELKLKEEELKDATFTEGRGEEELLKLRAEQQQRRKDFEKKRDKLIEHQKLAEKELQEQIERAQQQQREKDVERRKRRELDVKLIETIPLINEANAIADELSKPTAFAIKLVANNSYSRSCSQQSLSRSSSNDHNNGDAGNGSFSTDRSSSLTGSVHRARASIIDSKIKVAVMFTDNSQPMILWDFEKFESRLYLMREMFNDYSLDHGNLNRLNTIYTNEKDPFWDPPESRLIGTAVLYLDSLSFLLEIEETTPIIDFKGKQVGELTCELIAISVDFNDGHRKSIKLIDNFEEFQLKNFIGGILSLESEFHKVFVNYHYHILYLQLSKNFDLIFYF
jgi:pSer/pThr/pTyr-binding forkhead associated (FHA) protein